MKRLIFLILVLILSSSFVLSQGACTVVTESSCDSLDYVKVIKLSALENAHAGLISESDYGLVVCCDPSNTHFEVIYDDFFIFELSHITNAHVQEYTGNYPFPIGFMHDEPVQAWLCEIKREDQCDNGPDGNEFCVFDIFDLTNSHIAECGSWWVNPYVVCCEGTTSGPNELCNGEALDPGEVCDGEFLDECPDYLGWEPIGCSPTCDQCYYQDPNKPGWISAFIQSDCVACEGSSYTVPGYGTVNCDLGGGYYNSTIYSFFNDECSFIQCAAGQCTGGNCEVTYQLSACFLDKEEEVPFFDWFSVVLTFGLLVSYYYTKKRKSL